MEPTTPPPISTWPPGRAGAPDWEWAARALEQLLADCLLGAANQLQARSEALLMARLQRGML